MTTPEAAPRELTVALLGGGTVGSQVARLEAVVREQGVESDARPLTDDVAVGLVVALAHPDRIARKRSGGSSYLMTSGTGAALDRRDPGPLAGLEWLAIGDADRRSGEREARIRSAAPLTEDLALEAAGSQWTEVDEVSWTGGRVLARLIQKTIFEDLINPSAY